jgi:hypothetical protein
MGTAMLILSTRRFPLLLRHTECAYYGHTPHWPPWTHFATIHLLEEQATPAIPQEHTMNTWTKNRPALLAAGIVVGLVIGLNIQGLWPSVPLHATSTHGLDKFAIATGLVDNGVEALYFLDFLTGDMRAAVINPKTGKFNSFYTRNIAADFGGAGRSTGYLMVTGFADMPRGINNFQYAQSIVYVADVTTGNIAAYTIPWNSTRQAAGLTQYGEFQPLDVKPFRTAFVRDE